MPAESEGPESSADSASANKDAAVDNSSSSPIPATSSPASQAPSSIGEAAVDLRSNFIASAADRARENFPSIWQRSQPRLAQEDTPEPPKTPTKQLTARQSAIPHQADVTFFEYPSPVSQQTPSVEDVENDMILRRRIEIYQNLGASEDFLNKHLQISPQTPDHFTRRTTLHTGFAIKKVSTIQCDECKAKGKGEEIYKCSQCVKQICRSCMQGLLKRERLAQDKSAQRSLQGIADKEGDQDTYKWNWQGQYRHEGFKQCYLAREAAKSKGDFQVDVPLSLLGFASPDTITVYMFHENDDDGSPQNAKRPRNQMESDTSDEGDSPTPAAGALSRKDPKKPAKKRPRQSQTPTSQQLTDISSARSSGNERQRQTIAPRILQKLDRISDRILDPAPDAASTGRPNDRAQIAPAALQGPLSAPLVRPASAPLLAPTPSGRPIQAYSPSTQSTPQYGPPPPRHAYAPPHGPQTFAPTLRLQPYSEPQRAQNFIAQQQPAPVYVPPPGTVLMLPDSSGTLRQVTWEQYQRQASAPAPALPTRRVPPAIDTRLAQAHEHAELNPPTNSPPRSGVPAYRPQRVLRRGGRIKSEDRQDSGIPATTASNHGVSPPWRAFAGMNFRETAEIAGRQVVLLPCTNPQHPRAMPARPGPMVSLVSAVPYAHAMQESLARWGQATQAGRVSSPRRPSTVVISDEDEPGPEHRDAVPLTANRLDGQPPDGNIKRPSTPGTPFQSPDNSVPESSMPSSPPVSTAQQTPYPPARENTPAPSELNRPLRHFDSPLALRTLPNTPQNSSPLRNLLSGYYSEGDDTESDSSHEDGNVEEAPTIIQTPNQTSTLEQTYERDRIAELLHDIPTALDHPPAYQPMYHNAHHMPGRAEDAIRMMRRDATQRARMREALRHVPEAREMGLPSGPLSSAEASDNDGNRGRFRSTGARLSVDGSGHARIIPDPHSPTSVRQGNDDGADMGKPRARARLEYHKFTQDDDEEDEDEDEIRPRPQRKAKAAPSEEFDSEDEDDDDDLPSSPPVSDLPESSPLQTILATPTRRTRSGNEYTGLGRSETRRVTRRTPRKTAGRKST